MTIVRLAATTGDATRLVKAMSHGWESRGNVERRPALLVSYAYLKAFHVKGGLDSCRGMFRDYSMDSGAFTVKNSGGVIDAAAYMDECKMRLANDPQCTEVFALDVIGDHHASLKNVDMMWGAGIPAIPTYHYGEPVEALKYLAANFPKIALGGVVGLHQKAKRAWVSACFSQVWPKRIHGLGMASEDLLMAFPFESADASSWALGPAAFGRYLSYNGKLPGVTNNTMDLRSEVNHYLAMERRLQARWATTLAALSPSPPVTAP